MKLYNTLTRKVKDFKPPSKEAIKLYTCGPTVYHYAHIGNLRNVIFNDTLRRALEVRRYNVNHVMNITDVGHLVSDGDDGEDKLEKGAAREGKTVWEVAEYYIDAFNQHTNALNVLPPTKTVRATSAIDTQVEMVRILLDKGFAYQTAGAIYFDVTKLDDYGKLSGQKLSDKEVGARSEVVTDPDKRAPQDFALWFFTVGHFADHQMHWPTPWGEGFPGWHLECSAIIHETLGEPIDIHTGGVDHIGTHHTNEIAQSEAAYGKPLAHIWMHNEFLHEGGGKMSKSGGDTIMLDDVIKKGYDPVALRLLYLQSHYRSQANFTWDNLDAAQNRLKDYQNLADMSLQKPAKNLAIVSKVEQIKQGIMSAMSDDLSTPGALASLGQLNGYADHEFWVFIDEVLGLGLSNRPDITEAQKQIIVTRDEARVKNDWAKSDKLRDLLINQNIGLRDSEAGSVWYRL